jgi:hypothetical protein
MEHYTNLLPNGKMAPYKLSSSDHTFMELSSGKTMHRLENPDRFFAAMVEMQMKILLPDGQGDILLEADRHDGNQHGSYENGKLSINLFDLNQLDKVSFSSWMAVLKIFGLLEYKKAEVDPKFERLNPKSRIELAMEKHAIKIMIRDLFIDDLLTAPVQPHQLPDDFLKNTTKQTTMETLLSLMSSDAMIDIEGVQLKEGVMAYVKALSLAQRYSLALGEGQDMIRDRVEELVKKPIKELVEKRFARKVNIEHELSPIVSSKRSKS